jgi:Flp pilus assembly protein TadG
MSDRVRADRTFFSRRDKGQGLLEVALLLPVLIVIAAGILDLGRAYMTLVALNDAAAEGAAYAAIHPPADCTDDAAEQQIRNRAADASNALVQLDPAPGLITVDCSNPATPGNPITVTVGYSYTLITPVLNAIVPSGVIPLRATDVRSIMASP